MAACHLRPADRVDLIDDPPACGAGRRHRSRPARPAGTDVRSDWTATPPSRPASPPTTPSDTPSAVSWNLSAAVVGINRTVPPNFSANCRCTDTTDRRSAPRRPGRRAPRTPSAVLPTHRRDHHPPRRHLTPEMFGVELDVPPATRATRGRRCGGGRPSHCSRAAARNSGGAPEVGSPMLNRITHVVSVGDQQFGRPPPVLHRIERTDRRGTTRNPSCGRLCPGRGRTPI